MVVVHCGHDDSTINTVVVIVIVIIHMKYSECTQKLIVSQLHFPF